MAEHAGRSILDMLWEQLDIKVAQIIDQDEAGASLDHSGWEAYGELKGKAQGLAYAIAVIQNPYGPNIDAVRKEAQERYDAAD